MDLERAFFASAFALVAVAACGGNTGGSGSAANDVTKYQNLVVRVQSAATTYNATMLGPTGADCQRNHDQYDAQVRPLVSEMEQIAGEMDDVINSHGGAASADMKCGAATTLDELDYHASIACTLAGLSANQGEVARHADTINSFATHMLGRLDEVRTATAGGASSNWGPLMNGCESWSATCCSAMMRSGCCGGMMGRDGMKNGESCCAVGR
jgi:hypothetical protein